MTHHDQSTQVINDLNSELEGMRNQLEEQRSIFIEKEADFEKLNNEINSLLLEKSDTKEREHFLTERIKDLESVIEEFETTQSTFGIDVAIQ